MGFKRLSIEREQGGHAQSLTVSVIIPAYRGAKFIGRALDSVLAQTFTDYEIIIINDGSPDTEELEKVLSSYAEQITYISQPNTGPGGARNVGIRIARGLYLAFLDADDYWMPDYLKCQTGYLFGRESLDLVYADALLVGASPLAGRTFMEVTPSVGEVTCENLLDENCTLILSGTVVRRQSVLDADLFDEQFRYAEDFDLWVRLLKQGARFGYQKEVLLHRTEHSASLCSDAAVLFENALSVIEKIKRAGNLSPRERSALAMRQAKLRACISLEYARREFWADRFDIAAEQLKDANRFFRSLKLYCALFCIRRSPALLLRAYTSLRRSAFPRIDISAAQSSGLSSPS